MVRRPLFLMGIVIAGKGVAQRVDLSTQRAGRWLEKRNECSLPVPGPNPVCLCHDSHASGGQANCVEDPAGQLAFHGIPAELRPWLSRARALGPEILVCQDSTSATSRMLGDGCAIATQTAAPVSHSDYALAMKGSEHGSVAKARSCSACSVCHQDSV